MDVCDKDLGSLITCSSESGHCVSEAAVDFWTEKLGFSVISEENNGQGIRWIEIAPTRDAETSLSLQ